MTVANIHAPSQSAHRMPESLSPANSSSRAYRIALTDDHALVREGLRRLLDGEEDFQVVLEADSGEDLLTQLKEIACDLVILDLSMPGQGGLNTLAALKRQFPEIRSLVLTMHNEPGYMQKARNAQADGYILKDEKFDTLIQAVRSIRKGNQVYSNRVDRDESADAADSAQPAVPGEILSVRRSESRLPAAAGHGNLNLLTRREMQILRLIARGNMNKEIAAELGISKRTVEFHRANIMEKLNLRNLSELVRFAVTEGLA